MFLRHAGKVELTGIGRTMVPRFEAIASSVKAAVATAEVLRKQTSRVLRLGVMCTVGPTHVATLIERLLAEVPDAEITLRTGSSEEVVSLVETDEVDIGVAAWPRYPDFVAVCPLLNERFVLAMHAAHELAAMDAVPLSALDGCHYLDRLNCEFDAYFEAQGGAWTINLSVRFASEREGWIQALLVARLGVAIVPEFMELPPEVAIRPLVEPMTTREIGLVTLRGKPSGPLARRFLKLAAQHRWARPTAG